MQELKTFLSKKNTKFTIFLPDYKNNETLKNIHKIIPAHTEENLQLRIINSINKIKAIMEQEKIKKNNYFGSLNWDGEDIRFAKLKEIPFHVNLEIGDTIITSGYSLIFPENILIGTISSFDKVKGGDFYDITVKLSTDFNNINNIYVINNLKKIEILNLTADNDK